MKLTHIQELGSRKKKNGPTGTPQLDGTGLRFETLGSRAVNIPTNHAAKPIKLIDC